MMGRESWVQGRRIVGWEEEKLKVGRNGKVEDRKKRIMLEYLRECGVEEKDRGKG